MFVLSRCSTPVKPGGVLNDLQMSPEVPQKRTVFAIFCLGVLLLENNTYSLCDLIRYAKNGVISYDSSSQHVPPVMKIKENYDLSRHSGVLSHLNPLNHLKQRRVMGRLGKYSYVPNKRSTTLINFRRFFASLRSLFGSLRLLISILFLANTCIFFMSYKSHNYQK